MPSVGKLAVIEGLDGSGKATQTELLFQALLKEGRQIRKVSFPDYESDASALVRMYLSGEFGDKPESVNAYAASSFYAVDRYASWKKGWESFYKQGGAVIADRYATSNLLHQCVKLAPEERESYISWMEDFEYEKLGIPRPDLVIYLDVEPDVSQKLILERGGNIDKRDIHERDIAYLLRCRETALWCAEKQDWQVIPCTQDGKMRTREEIAADIWALTEEKLWNSKM